MPVNASLQLETSLQQSRTRLRHLYCTQPFKVANVTEDKQKSLLQLMLMSASPGILDGDHYEVAIEVGEGCRLSLETQSYQRVFHMQAGASQQWTVRLKKGSTFQYLPHPLVLHKAAIFRSKTSIYLESGCSLVWGEVISCGRKLNGELFQFSRYHSVTEIFLNHKCVVKENLLLQPLESDCRQIGQWEGFTHQATLFFIDEKLDSQPFIERLLPVFANCEGISAGASALAVNGVAIRVLGCKAERLFLLLKQLAQIYSTEQLYTNKKTGEAHVC